MPRLALLGIALALSGCRHYWVEERTLDAVASQPRGARNRTIVAAERSDGAAVLLRADDIKPEPVVAGVRRRVRVLRPAAVAGAVVLAGGLAWMVASWGFYFAPQDSCTKPEQCTAANVTRWAFMLAVGGAQAIAGSIMLGVGARPPEVHEAARFQELRP
jgi:hypothetical protein